MKTPMEKYNNDVDFRRVVDMIESLIVNAQFTPSEIREAAVLACINNEMRQPRPIGLPPHIHRSLKDLEEFRNTPNGYGV